MKTLKKAVSLLLAIFMMGSIAVISAGAAEQEQQPDMEELRQKFNAYLDEKGVNHISPGEEAEDMTFITFIAKTNGWIVFYGMPGYSSPMFTSDRIGDYIFMNSSWDIPYKIGLYAEKNGEIFTLKEAFSKGELDIDTVANSGALFISTFQPGDTDMNGNVAITDVLNVQKVIAKESAIDSYYATFNLYDYDGDETITVKDVLGMQNQIAKITDGPV